MALIWDADLTQLGQRVRDTFGEDARQAAINRALNAMQASLPDDLGQPFDGNAVFREMLRLEFRRLLQPQ